MPCSSGSFSFKAFAGPKTANPGPTSHWIDASTFPWSLCQFAESSPTSSVSSRRLIRSPVLAEIVAPNPDISIPGGTYTARQLLDITVRAIPSYRWQNQDGVAHIYQRRVVDARGNLLNLRIHRFMTPQNVRDFNMIFRACLKSTVQGFGCMGAVITEITPAFFEKEKLGIEIFKDRTAREVLLWALQDNGFCYVVLGYPNSRPKLPGDAEFTFVNWHLRSLRTQEPDPIWIQSPRN